MTKSKDENSTSERCRELWAKHPNVTAAVIAEMAGTSEPNAQKTKPLKTKDRMNALKFKRMVL